MTVNHSDLEDLPRRVKIATLANYVLMEALKAKYGLEGIALSGYGMEQDIARSKAVGFAQHLIKPIQVQALDAALAQLVQR